jgi:hypothetical protein
MKGTGTRRKKTRRVAEEMNRLLTRSTSRYLS